MNLPNFISLIRIPLALLFIIPSVPLRLFSLTLALLSDGLDGYLARKYHLQTPLGKTIDPLSDKFFVVVALATLFFENKITPFEITAFLTRDLSLILFALYLYAAGRWGSFRFRSIISGKLMTLLQFVTLTLLVVGIEPSPIFYALFIILGISALGELYFTRHHEA